MLKKTIKYTDFDDNERTVDAYFNLTKAELANMEMTTVGGMEQFINNIINEHDTAALARMFEDLILMSYGKKSPDGQRFVKSPQLSEEFKQTNAYSELFMELLTNAEAAAYFVAGIVPQNALPKDKSKDELVKETLAKADSLSAN